MMAAVRECRVVVHEKVVEYEEGTPRALTSKVCVFTDTGDFSQRFFDCDYYE